MKIAIIGSRGFDDYELLKRSLEPFRDQITLVISGGAKGADSLGEKWARENGIETKIFLPEYSKFGRGATFIRNEYIVKESESVFSFWDGSSKGTKHAMRIAEKMDKEVKIIRY